MTTVLIAFFIILLVVCIMSIGVLMGRKPLKGSCGGLSSLGLKESCDICGGNDEACEKEQQRQKKAVQNTAPSLAYEASKKPKNPTAKS